MWTTRKHPLVAANPVPTVRLRRPHAGQLQVLREAARFNVVDCGRRWGKTEMGCNQAARIAVEGQPAGWFAPNYKLLLEAWRLIKSRLAPITARASDSDHRIELVTGGVVEAWSCDSADPARGRKYARVVIDEAAMVQNFEAVWNGAIRPTLTDLKGDAWFLSTPKGRNYFWHMFTRGQDPLEAEWRSWQMPTVTNPHIDPTEVEAARRSTPERWFAQEYLADFIDDAGMVFRGLTSICDAVQQDQAVEGHRYVIGVDWGKSEDFTVFAVLDTTMEHIVYLDRSNKVDYRIQRQRLQAVHDRFRPDRIIAEQNSIGDPIIEELRAGGMWVEPFVTTNRTKAEAIEKLALAVETQRVHVINNPVLLSEMQSFEFDRLPSGLVRYSAPEGCHDDTVMAVALAWHSHAAGRKVSVW